MLSKIMVEIDFDTMQPLLRIKQDLNSEVLADKTLNHFIQKVSNGWQLYLSYADYSDRKDNSVVEIRCEKKAEPEPDRPVSDEELLDQKYCIINATYQQDWGDGHAPYVKDHTFNLKFANGDNNSILVKQSKRDVEDAGFVKYASLAQFLSYWKVNNPMGH